MRNLRFYILGIFVLISMTYCRIENLNEKPLLNIVLPVDNHSIFKGDSVIIIVQANDPDGLVETVDFNIDNQNVFQTRIQPYEYVWHTYNAKGGQHKITIIVTDNLGLSDSMSINVIVNTISPSIITLPISFIGTSYAASGGNVTSIGIPSIINRGLCWNKLGSPTIYDSNLIMAGDSGLFEGGMTGLELGETYFVKAFAENVDTIVYGNEFSFTTYTSYVSDSGTFVDNRDSTLYKWVKIGNQIWMAENLKYLTAGINAFVPNFYDASYGWEHIYSKPIKDAEAAKLTENYKIYGCLYLPLQGLCPSGWHIPSTKEWRELINYLGGTGVAGGLLKESGIVHWKTPNTGATNQSQFTALPAGWVTTKYHDKYGGINEFAGFYTSDIGKVSIRWDSESVSLADKPSSWNGWENNSIRCIKD